MNVKESNRVLENLKKSFGKEKKAVIIRHAERYSIEKMINAFEAELTGKGENDAFDFGKEIAGMGKPDEGDSILFYHSPIKRCFQTADLIMKGLGKNGYVSRMGGILSQLGGPYITGDWQDVVDEIEKLGYDVFIRKWFDDEFPADLLMSLRDSAVTIMNALCSTLETSNSFTVNVTHDLNILVLREYFFNIRHEDAGIPDFLDGVVLCWEGETYSLMYGDMKVPVDILL